MAGSTQTASKVLNLGSNSIPLGDLKLRHMTMHLLTRFPDHIGFNEFTDLPHHGWDNDAPVAQALKRTNGYFRFRLPPTNRWMLGHTLDRRTINCWTTDFPPFVSCRDEFVMPFVHEAQHADPGVLGGRVGTLLGAKLISKALEAVPEEVLWEWLAYKEKQRLEQ